MDERKRVVGVLSDLIDSLRDVPENEAHAPEEPEEKEKQMDFDMNLYRIVYDEEKVYVEARSLCVAIELWWTMMKNECGDEWDEMEEPDSVALVQSGPVIRERLECCAEQT